MSGKIMPLKFVKEALKTNEDIKNLEQDFVKVVPENALSESDKYRLWENLGESYDQHKEEKEALKKESKLEVFFTKEKELMDQYFTLRHNVYRDENGWKDYNGFENQFDRGGRIIVAVSEGRVIGGMRLMFSDECEFLSNEIPGTQYDYKKFIKRYDSRDNLVISEISALVVDKDFRNSTVATSMMEALFKKSVEHGCDYVFGVAVALVCRNDRRTVKRLGYDVEIVINFPWRQSKTYNFARMFPMYTKIK